MNAVRLALLNASHNDVNTARNFRREVDADLVEFNVSSGQLPERFDFDGCIVTGSSSSVYWDEEWIGPLKRWVRTAIDRNLPFLGICYGHQLLADVLGGRVEAMGVYELGYREITHTCESRLFDGIPERFVAFTTHSDTVTELPPDAVAIAENDYGLHGFERGHIFGVQFHPEYDMQTAEAITRAKDLPAKQIREVIAGITEEQYAAACTTKLVFENFIGIVHTHRKENVDTIASSI